MMHKRGGGGGGGGGVAAGVGRGPRLLQAVFLCVYEAYIIMTCKVYHTMTFFFFVFFFSFRFILFFSFLSIKNILLRTQNPPRFSLFLDNNI